MKKIYTLITILSFLFIENVYAGSARITISPNSKTVIAGNTFTVTVNISSTDPMAGLSYSVQYNSSLLSLEGTSASTGGARNLDAFMNNSTYSASYTYRFRAKASGTATISITGAEVRNSSDALSVSTGTSTIKIMTQKELEATYSKNNYLAGLSIEGYELDPVFNRDTTEYKVTLKPETERIVINAAKEDGTATVNGAGEVSVSEGVNTLKIDVVAQNGNIKTYTIVATVEEYDPITVLVNGEKYTVVRSKKALTFDNNLFVPTTVNISSNDIPAFNNETTNTTVVALKNSEGIIKYFIYKDGEYTEFLEMKHGRVDLLVKEGNILPGYKKASLDINGVVYPVLKTSDVSRFSLIYGTNMNNNNTGYYVYDEYENTLQRYDTLYADEVNNKISKLAYVARGTIALSVILIILLILSNLDKTSSKKATKKEEVVKRHSTKEVEQELQKQIDMVYDSISKTKEKKKK